MRASTRLGLTAGIGIGCLLCAVLACGAQSPSAAPTAAVDARPVATASAGEGGNDLPAQNAIDGDEKTRWSSAFTDNEWLQIDFGSPRDIAGVRILWETAYGRDYDLLLSDDAKVWRTACAVRDGDGGVDELFFAPQKARYLKMQGLKRGTGWGFSIFELKALSPEDAPRLSATSERQPAGKALDGDTKTFWQSATSGAQSLTLDLRTPHDLGGMQLFWGDAFPTSYVIEGSNDGGQWQQLAAIEEADGGEDLVFFPRGTHRFVRVAAANVPASGIAIREVGLKGGGESWSPVRHFEALLTRHPVGLFPRWLARQQEFWTVVGLPHDPEELLLAEGGSVEPRFNSPSLMPLVLLGEEIVTARDVEVTQSLENDFLPLPAVHWRGKVDLTVRAVATGQAGKSTTLVEYRLSNPGDAPLAASLVLALRPLAVNPPWQYGGFAAIKSASYANQALTIDTTIFLQSLVAPSQVWFATRKQGDAILLLGHGDLPAEPSATDADGLVTAGLRYDLAIPARGARSVVVAFPQHAASVLPPATTDPAALFAKAFAAEKTRWLKLLDTWNISLPVADLSNVLKANLAYMIINHDHAAPQPGSRNYAKAWMRDGSLGSLALLRYNFAPEVKRYLDWFRNCVGADGYVPPLVQSDLSKAPDWARDWKEYDAQGEFVYITRQYWEFTRDKAFLARLYPVVIQVLKFQDSLLEQRRTDKHKGTEYYGILPESNSHEGYFPAMHSYWDDFFAIRGLTDGVALANAMGRKEDATRLAAEAERFRKDFYNSMLAVIRKHGMDRIPGCAEKGDIDPTSTSIALDHCGEQEFLLADPVLGPNLRRHFDLYFDEVKPRWATKNVWSSFTPYEVRNIEALMRLGERDKAAELLGFFLGEPLRPRSWRHMAEVVHYDPRTASYIGDMPHTWISADFLNAVRSFFLIESADERLVLAAGITRAWLESDSGVAVRGLPTWWGPIQYAFKRTEPGVYVFTATGKAKPPKGFQLAHPFGDKVSEVWVNGKKAEKVEPGVVNFTVLPATIKLVVRQ